MKPSPILRAAMAVALALAYAAAGVSAPAAAGTDDLEAAARLHDDCHWPEVFAAYARLADTGQPEAARIAAQMVRHGRALHGQSFDAAPERVARWRGAAVATRQAPR